MKTKCHPSSLSWLSQVESSEYPLECYEHQRSNIQGRLLGKTRRSGVPVEVVAAQLASECVARCVAFCVVAEISLVRVV